MFASPYTSPSQHDPYTNMGSDYPSPYYLGTPYPFSYQESPTSPHFPPTRLPDLYYDYGLETSPSSKSSEMIPTPPSAQTPLPLTNFMVPAYPRTLTCQPNTTMGTEIYDECPAIASPMAQHSPKRQGTMPHSTPHPHEVLDFPLTAHFVSPLDTLLGPWVPDNTASPAPSLLSLPKLHQPRPSRRIPIVNLNELASACETSHHSSQGIGSKSYPPYQWPEQLSALPICEPIVTQGLREDVDLALCFCGCLDSESYRQ